MVLMYFVLLRLRNEYLIITSKRRFDVIIRYLFRIMFVGYGHTMGFRLCIGAGGRFKKA